MKMPKITFWRILFVIIIILGLYSSYVRFFKGLGASTNLSDEFPWGFWIGFDVLCGVGLAAGGFVLAAIVYIFNLENYKSVLRPTILTAFLGYILVGIGLLFDVGRPWFLWHPLIMWNHTSVMFEVSWCVMLYTTVLALEFSPIVFEKFKLERPKKIIKSITIPLVIAGVVLSTLHQSSLGSVYLILPEKIYPLWYSSRLPYLFFISAIGAGASMVIIESFLSYRAFKKEIEINVLAKLAKVTVVTSAIYLVLRFEDLLRNGALPYMMKLNTEGILFWLEILLGFIIPIVLFVQRKVRYNRKLLFVVGFSAIIGFVLNRMNVAITSLEHFAGKNYFPSVYEILISLMLVAVGFFVFALAVKYLPIFSFKDNEIDMEKYKSIPFNS